MAHEDLFTHQLQSIASPYAQMASMESPVCVRVCPAAGSLLVSYGYRVTPPSAGVLVYKRIGLRQPLTVWLPWLTLCSLCIYVSFMEGF